MMPSPRRTSLIERRTSGTVILRPATITTTDRLRVPSKGCGQPQGERCPGCTPMSMPVEPSGRTSISCPEVLFTQTKSEPSRNDTTKAPRAGATSTLQMSRWCLSSIVGSMKGVEPAEMSPQKTRLDQLADPCRNGLKCKQATDISASSRGAFQWNSQELRARSFSRRPHGVRTSRLTSEALDSTSRGLNVRTWHWAPNTSAITTSETCAQSTRGPCDSTSVARTHQLGGAAKLQL
mmetsp:Transcript_90830/g.293259  ORF Transcript_90830/g.293259 Transcript_90830/m.293259 type:complete len:236 (-) Transcript_90830:1721-2428(-)